MALELSFVPNGNKMISSYLDGGKDIGVKPIWEYDELTVTTPLVADDSYKFTIIDTLIPLTMIVDASLASEGYLVATLSSVDSANNLRWSMEFSSGGQGTSYGTTVIFQFPNPMPIEKGTFLSVSLSQPSNWLSIYCERMGVIRKHCPIRAN